jgi:ketosteroid isomerase-like protein
VASNQDVMGQFVTAALSGDGETLKSLCAPGMVLEQGSGMPYRGTYRGGEGFMHFLGVFGETFDIEKLDLVRTYQTDDPDWLVSEFDVRATVKATGAPYATSLVETWQFEDGKVLSIKPHYFNSPLHG